MKQFTCTRCGQTHQFPAGLGAEAPDMWHDMSPAERNSGCILDVETCVIKDEVYFVKGALDVPIQDENAFFTYTVWVSLGEDDFATMLVSWQDAMRKHQAPYFGWLGTRIPTYPETINLRTNVFNNDLGVRPSVILEPTEHPLAQEQRNGISRAKLQDMIELLIHAEEEEL